jgi:hypothetical protein
MALYLRGTETNGVQRSTDLTVISQEIFDPTPSTYPVDWCETWEFRWKTKLRKSGLLKGFYEEREG